MRASDMIKSNYISKAEVKAAGQLILTIVDCSLERMGGNGDEKWILWFNEHPKGLGLNNTKIRLLEAAYGEESSLWTGKRVRLTYDPTVQMAGQVVGGIKLTCSTQAGARPNGQAVPPGAPPPPVWNGTAWVTQAPPPSQPPPPVWDAVNNRWVVSTPSPAAAPPGAQEFVDHSTGEITSQASPAAPVQRHVRAPTISERVNQDHPPADYTAFPPPGSPAEFDDDIPF